jgi:hypothetical protein
MRTKLIQATSFGWFSLALVLLACPELRAQNADMKLQAFLLWGTDDNKPRAGKNYTPATPEIMQKLRDLPLKWTNWFEVNRKEFTVVLGEVKAVAISQKCQLNVSKTSVTEVEVSLIGKGKEVVKRKQSLPIGEMLVLGGNAPNSTAWLVVLKRTE